MIETIIAFDPGKTTGVAAFSRHFVLNDPEKTDGSIPSSMKIFDSFQIDYDSIISPYHDLYFDIITNLFKGIDKNIKSSTDKVVIIVEDYIIAPGRNITHSREPLKTMGIIDYVFKDYNIITMPSAKKEYASDDKLNSIKKYVYVDKLKFMGSKGWYTEGQPHANDAARHILTWATENIRKLDPFLSKIIKYGQIKFLNEITD